MGAVAAACRGMILGPVVQKYAFGDLWTGIPFGWDLTDNKTLIAVFAWILAVVMNRKKDRPAYTIAAAILSPAGLFHPSQPLWFRA
ncbi:MAG: hypothetical protein MZV63_45435 [Marinilabiliales bacterium]|nr:hypothetical protein [Marinilabiliales bacterium]